MAAAALWGMLGPFARLAFSQGLLPMEVAFWRAALAWIFFGAHAVMTRQVRMAPADLPAMLVFALTGVTLFYGSYQVAVQQGGAALAAVLLYTAPAWVTVLARFFFAEAITRMKVAALTLTLAGVCGVSLGAGKSGLGQAITPRRHRRRPDRGFMLFHVLSFRKTIFQPLQFAQPLFIHAPPWAP